MTAVRTEATLSICLDNDGCSLCSLFNRCVNNVCCLNVEMIFLANVVKCMEVGNIFLFFYRKSVYKAFLVSCVLLSMNESRTDANAYKAHKLISPFLN